MIGKLSLRTTLGAAIACIIGTIRYGTDFLGGIGLAIGCTRGFALLIYLPIAYGIGLAATIWWIPLGSNWSYERRRATSLRMPHGDEAQTGQRSPANRGSAADIKLRLSSTGWDRADIREGPTPLELVCHEPSWTIRAKQALADYAARASQLGDSPALIERRLLEAGWTPAMVHATLATIETPSPKTTPTHAPSPARPDPS